jgi:hypothetical protein
MRKSKVIKKASRTFKILIDLLGKNITKDIFSAVKKATSHLQGRINQQSSGAQAST